MLDIRVQRVLIAFVRRNALATYRAEIAALRDHYARRIAAHGSYAERFALGWTYAQAKRALVIRLAACVSAEQS